METNIPIQNSKAILGDLYDAGKNLTGEGCVVEMGCWLGGSIAPVAKALKDSNKEVDIHCYDRFYVAPDRCGKSEVEKAKARGVSLKLKQDTLPLVKSYLNPINSNIIYHKCDVYNAKWVGEPIELYMDDVCKAKPLFLHSLKVFSPYWVPNKTILFLMDFNYWAAKSQKIFMKKYNDHFIKIKEFGNYSSCAIFLYTKKLNSIEF